MTILERSPDGPLARAMDQNVDAALQASEPAMTPHQPTWIVELIEHVKRLGGARHILADGAAAASKLPTEVLFHFAWTTMVSGDAQTSKAIGMIVLARAQALIEAMNSGMRQDRAKDVAQDVIVVLLLALQLRSAPNVSLLCNGLVSASPD